MPTLFTLGHSTRDLTEFSRVLQAHEIRLLVDIRSWPASRRMPHFNRDRLAEWMPGIGVDYIWEKDLGGKRGEQMPAEESPNVALQEPALRNYADYMLSTQFCEAIGRLTVLAASQATAIMCAERDYRQCHRQLVSDYLLHQGHTVLHIEDEGPPVAHDFTPDARIVDGALIYRGNRLF